MHTHAPSLVRRSPVQVAVLALVLVLSLLGASTVVANADDLSVGGSNFEIDQNANLVVDDVDGVDPQHVDWASVIEIRKADEPSGSGDDSFTQGTSENTEPPIPDFGSIPPNKSDLTTFGIHQEGEGADTVLHLFWTRVQEPNGTTNMDFEFNQSEDLSTNGITPVRTSGDLLIEYKLSKGGTTPQLFLYRWQNGDTEPDDVQPCEAGSLPCWSARQELGAGTDPAAVGSINTSAITGPHSDGLGPLSAFTFGEASINMSLVFDSDQCQSFGSVYLKSRSSDSFTAALKDYIAPTGINLSNCGTVTVAKETVGGDGTFGFTSTLVVPPPGDGEDPLDPDPANFDLTTVDGSASTTITDVLAGTGYTITEDTLPTGWDLTDIECLDGSGVEVGSTDEATATFDVAIGQDITCTFTNEARGTIVVAKETDPDGDTADFTFDRSWVEGGADLSLSDGESASTVGLVAGETYVVAEDTPDGWDLVDTTCVSSLGDTEVAGGIDLDPGETVTCTFTNQKDAFIVVEKQTLPDGDPATFDFTGSWDDDGFSLPDDGSESSDDLAPGHYTVSEEDLDGWDQTDTQCVSSTGDEGEAIDGISLQAGETVTCTFTNTRRGSIVVDKVTDPVGDTTAFEFDRSWVDNDPDTDHDLLLAGVDSPAASDNLVPGGGYSVVEHLPEGWDFEGSGCLGAGGVNKGDGSDLTLDPGETITCTFDNEKDANIVVVKETVGGDGTFTFDPSWSDDDFTLAHGDVEDSGDLDPGSYSVAEADLQGWDLTDTACVSSNGDEGEAIDDIDLQAGETVTCTFTNTRRGSIVVAKETDPDGDTAEFQFDRSWVDDFDGAVHDLVLSDGQSASSDDMVPGAGYSVTELDLDGWGQESVECVNDDEVDQGTAANLTLDPGETITCTFTNEKDATITVTKVTAGGDGEFTFSPSWGDDFVLSDGETHDSGDLDPGAHSVSEDVPGGWQLTGTDCVSSNGDVETIGDIDLQAGETVDCTFTNTKSGSIAVKKVTVPGESTHLFDFTGDVTAELSDGQTSPPVPVEPGQYNVVETALAGWDLTDIDCDDDNSTGSLVSGTAMINVSPGEDVVCTFTNTQRARIDILKVDDAGNPLAGVTFSLSNDNAPVGGSVGVEDTDTGQDCTTDASGECSFDDLVPGNYWVVEDVAPDGHIGAEPQAISLAAGDLDGEVELTFVNERLHKAIALTCHMGTNDLVASDVTVEGVDITTIEATDLVGTDLEDLEAALCGLAGVEDLEHGEVAATIHVGTVGGGLHP